ncbi:hypothetical protein BJ973_002055 [Actinoplanes tereljensis]|uniref:DUF4034 domain-containing protein n=1 Tax=Paractinoplanes tereljensis TaxID=571912 RepID=A0A919NKZ6_9ACTN|nr:hypothetical protein [Actinoplanes tereljensis]GIF20040.1 hypothetical protein Ate02nite_27700 [Actinoplanes tereljensis]
MSSFMQFERALVQRDWPTARAVLTVADADHFAAYLGYAAHLKGVEEWIPDVVRAEPHSILPLLIRGARAVSWAWEARGSGWGNKLSEQQLTVWVRRLELAQNCLDEVVARDPKCVEAWHYQVTLSRARQVPAEEAWRRFDRLTDISPAHLHGHLQMLEYLKPKWFGSPEMMFDFARTRAAAHPGTDLPILVAEAHLEHRRAEGGDKYLRRTDVAGEIYAAAHNSFWHESYRWSLSTPLLWNNFAYSLTLAGYYREACNIYDLIGEDCVRTSPWGSTERFTELRDQARDQADDIYDPQGG